MKLFVAWDTWNKSNEPQFSAGYDLKDAFNNHPWSKAILDDQNSRYFGGVVKAAAADI